jgi:hypothetical protein
MSTLLIVILVLFLLGEGVGIFPLARVLRRLGGLGPETALSRAQFV